MCLSRWVADVDRSSEHGQPAHGGQGRGVGWGVESQAQERQGAHTRTPTPCPGCSEARLQYWGKGTQDCWPLSGRGSVPSPSQLCAGGPGGCVIVDVHVQVCAQADLVVLPSALRRERSRAPTPGVEWGAAAWEGRPAFHGHGSWAARGEYGSAWKAVMHAS